VQGIEHGKAKLPTANALAFWILLGGMTVAIVQVIGRVLEVTSDRASAAVEKTLVIDGLWQDSTEIARVSSAPDGIFVLLGPRSGHPSERAYHFRYLTSAGSAAAYVGDGDARSTATWESGELRLRLPGRRLILRRP